MMKELSMNEAEKVVGGTVAEFSELLEAASINPTARLISMLGSHMPNTNSIIKPAVGKLLARMGIKADISLGIGGTGLFAEANRYTRNGVSISHQEVLEAIRAWSGRV